MPFRCRCNVEPLSDEELLQLDRELIQMPWYPQTRGKIEIELRRRRLLRNPEVPNGR